MFNPVFCSVCSDLSRFNTMVNDANNISNYFNKRIYSFKYDYYLLNRREILKREYSKEDYDILMKINYDHKNIHFGCGSCYKANINNLSITEDELKFKFIVVCRILNLLKEDIKKDSYLKTFVIDLARCIQGHYNLMNRYLYNNFLN